MRWSSRSAEAEETRPSDRSKWSRLRSDRGDAGLPVLLIAVPLLLVTLHLINATQQLYERREAFAVAASAARLGSQGDPAVVRDETRTDLLDPATARANIIAYVAAQGPEWSVVGDPVFDGPQADGTYIVTVVVQKTVNYTFPNAGLSTAIQGEAEAITTVGVGP